LKAKPDDVVYFKMESASSVRIESGVNLVDALAEQAIWENRSAGIVAIDDADRDADGRDREHDERCIRRGERGVCLNQAAFRRSIAFGCVAGGIWLHYGGNIDFAAGMILWLLLAAGAGYMRPFGWTVAIAPIPWLLGVGGGVLTGRYDGFGDVWFVAFLVSTLAGVIGVIMGAGAARSRGRHLQD
jgi:hypothetical protein